MIAFRRGGQWPDALKELGPVIFVAGNTHNTAGTQGAHLKNQSSRIRASLLAFRVG